ncbi:unnamed protein product, partial [Polarella glacialis]
VEQMLMFSSHLQQACDWVSTCGDVPMEKARWAVGAVVSRSFSVDTGEDFVRALPPLADIFNHKPLSTATWAAAETEDFDAELQRPETAWALSQDGQRLEVRALFPAAPGEEVLISYGEETLGEILAVHGFIPRDNEADYLEMFETHEELVLAAESLSKASAPVRPIMERLEATEAAEAPLALRPGGLRASGYMLGCMEAALASAEELQNFREEWSDEVGHRILVPSANVPLQRRQELSQQAVSVISSIAQGVLRGLSSASEDQLELAKSSGDEGEPRRLAVQYRLHVKQMISDFVDQVNAKYH